MIAQATNYVRSVDNTFIFITVISVLLLLFVTFLMLYFVFKYSRKRNPKATNIHGNVPLEIAWTLIPTLLVLVMFWFGWSDYKKYSDVPKDSLVIEADARMWKWSFKYPNGLVTDTLFVPLKKDIRINLHSLDVNHAFFIPAFRIKKDVIPNRENYVWFNANETGSFDLMCAEYCGLWHSNMYTRIVILPQKDYDYLIATRSGIHQQDSTEARGKINSNDDTTGIEKDR